MKQFKSVVDSNRNVLEGYGYSNCVNAVLLAASTNVTHTVPSGAKKVNFSGTANFYVKFGGAAAIPGAEITNGTGSCLNPGLRDLDDATTIGIISPTAGCIVTMEFFS